MFKDSAKAIGAPAYGGQTLAMNTSVHSLFSIAEVSCGKRQTGNSSSCPVSAFLFWSRTRRTISRAVISRPFFGANAVYPVSANFALALVDHPLKSTEVRLFPLRLRYFPAVLLAAFSSRSARGRPV